MSKNWFARKHDVILFYTKSSKKDEHTFNVQKERSFNRDYKPYRFAGVEEFQDEFGRWYTMASMRDVWDVDMVGRTSKERTGYPTQKPLSLLKRILKASLPATGIVLDPFCGCATTLVAADRLPRDWIGIDISPKAAELVVERIKADQGFFQEIIHREDVPERTDLGNIPRYNVPENKQQLYGKQEGYCNGCKEHFQSRLLEVDHIIATSVGGTDHIDNLQLLCSYCNRVKGDRGQEYLLSRLNS